MQETIEFIVKKLVSKPENVKVTIIEENDNTLYSIKVDSSDRGRIIGRQGRIINSIRIVLKAVSKNPKDKILIKVEE